ncbi:phosphoribosylanthranilate isomerase [Candidatus Synechococcus calcipolaris G9]|uniref:N-(5'-phosphoribosyl)anthranilate isomerase n=1 Tax=Candidatus Synechococcus calcipolaris G9 TaxID=1497997 RepID=A0ABT6EXN5_9SYNE|nr:phosphoribosylanthranilate isomerase [Candidatus Synechococcus calcipolaris]MDG2990308.1 phosphoribosylanthranilate isomerase [Candidatus Synechococcus calcipolaris G9]
MFKNIQVKICGLTSLEQAQAIAARGVTALGFICLDRSPRYIDPGAIAKILQALPNSLLTVGVFVNHSLDEIYDIAHHTGLKGLQLHGNESVEFCQALRHALPEQVLIKAIQVRDAQALERAKTYDQTVDILLLDAYHPQQWGGTGQVLDWSLLQTFQPACPWWLAGGLKPENIHQALTMANPQGVDVSSGVERSPGIKDIFLVEQLLDTLTEANYRLNNYP